MLFAAWRSSFIFAGQSHHEPLVVPCSFMILILKHDAMLIYFN